MNRSKDACSTLVSHGSLEAVFEFFKIFKQCPGFQKQLDWVQSSLLTYCAARLGTYDGQEFRYPIACLSLKMNVACPMVPWSEVEALGLRSELFLYLLHRLGLLPVAPHGGLYPRIPREWSADALYSVALFFGPVDQGRVDFDLSLVNKVDLPIPDASDDMPSSNGQLRFIRNFSFNSTLFSFDKNRVEFLECVLMRYLHNDLVSRP